MKKGLFLIVSLILATVLGGCNNYLGNKNVGHYDNKNSTDLLKVGNDNDDNRVEEHGLDQDEITEQNPNFLNLNTDNETHVNNIGFALDKAKGIVRNNGQFEAGPIWRNGGTLHITVYPKGDQSRQQLEHARKKLEKQLIAAIPTYEIDVEIGNR